MNTEKTDPTTRAAYTRVLRETTYKGVTTREVYFGSLPDDATFYMPDGEKCVKLSAERYRPESMETTSLWMAGTGVVHVHHKHKDKPAAAKPEHPCTRDLCEALGWQGGTIHQVLAEIIRLKAFERAQAMPAPALTKTVTTCPHCGGFHVHQDANYNVNYGTYSTYDNHTCGDCSYDGHSFNSYTVPADFDYEVDSLAEATAAAALLIQPA